MLTPREAERKLHNFKIQAVNLLCHNFWLPHWTCPFQGVAPYFTAWVLYICITEAVSISTALFCEDSMKLTAKNATLKFLLITHWCGIMVS